MEIKDLFFELICFLFFQIIFLGVDYVNLLCSTIRYYVKHCGCRKIKKKLAKEKNAISKCVLLTTNNFAPPISTYFITAKCCYFVFAEIVFYNTNGNDFFQCTSYCDEFTQTNVNIVQIRR